MAAPLLRDWLKVYPEENPDNVSNCRRFPSRLARECRGRSCPAVRFERIERFIAEQAAGFHFGIPEARNPAWVALDFLNVESMIAGGAVPGTARKVPLKADVILAPGTTRCEP